MYLNKTFYILFITYTVLTISVWGQNASQASLENIDESQRTAYYQDEFVQITHLDYRIDWTSMELITNIHFTWEPSTIQHYHNPNRANNIAQRQRASFFSDMTPYINIHAQKSLLDFAKDNSNYREVLSSLLLHSSIVSQTPTKNLWGTTIQYYTSLVPLVQQIIYPTLSKINIPILSTPLQDITQYTSIIFSLENILPLSYQDDSMHVFTPKVLPKVFDETQLILVYSPEYFDSTSPLQNNPYTYIYRKDYQTADTGDTPLLIIPKGLNNPELGDIVISRNDTERILSSSNSRKLIEHGKVIFIIPEQPTQGIISK